MLQPIGKLANLLGNVIMHKAIIWDYDGTLVDTSLKNFNVTRKILQRVVGERALEYAAVRTLDNYRLANKRAKNWRELYKNEFGLNEERIDEAGRLWTTYQLSDDSEITFFEGVEETVRSLSKYPNLVFSQNSKSNIVRVLEERALLHCFHDVVGYEEISLRRQKPEPDGLFVCLDKLEGTNCRQIFFVGDHETDTLCGHNANRKLKSEHRDMQIITIAATYGTTNDISDWPIKPDHAVKSVREIYTYIENC